MKLFLLGLLSLSLVSSVKADGVADYLQNISVTIATNTGSGSGVTIVRGEDTFVLTAAHVVDGLRKVREVIDAKSGTRRAVVEFDDAKVVKVLVESGRKVGRLEFDAEVIRYSDADTGEDLALLRVRKKGFVKEGVKFYLDEKTPDIGTNLFHVGSMLGEAGSNSMTTGIMSQHGRLVGKTVYDQTSCTTFPGCLTGDTMVTVSDGSEKTIASLLEGDEVLAYDSRVVMADGTWSRSIKEGDQVLSFQTISGQVKKKTGDCNLRPVTRGRVDRAWPTGVKPVYKISTRNRSIKATGNHPFVKVVTVQSIDSHTYHIAQWCRADELKPGDIVAVMQQHVPYRKSGGMDLTKTFGSKDNHIPMMRLAGFYVGDGHSRIRDGMGGEACFYTFNDADYERYSTIIRDCCGLNPRPATSPSGTYIRVSSIKLASLLKNLEVTGNALTKRIPTWVFKCPPELQREFIEGYVDADGHRRRGGYVLECANEDLIYDFASLASNLGMGVSNVSTRNRLATIKGGREISSKCWSCEIYPDPVKSGAQMDGTKLLPDGLKFERIASIDPAGGEMTYDITVRNYSNFFANGFLVHNSSGGGVFLTDGQYIGSLVRGAGPGFNLIVPVRRIVAWSKSAGVYWAIDPSVPMPSDEELKKIPVDDSGVQFSSDAREAKDGKPTPATPPADDPETESGFPILPQRK